MYAIRSYYDLGNIRILARQNARQHLYLCDLTTEARERLGQLAADGATAEDYQALRRITSYNVCYTKLLRVVTLTNLDAGKITRYQCAGNPKVFGVAEQVPRIVKSKGQTDDSGDRCQGDVTLAPVKTNAEHTLASYNFV